MRKKDRKLYFFGALVLLIVLTALFSDYLVPCDPYAQDLGRSLLPPSAEHLLGTDRYGRDLLSRVIAGSRTTVFSALALVAIIALAGSAVGIVSGFCGGKLDAILMRISDVFLAFPGMVFAIAVAGVTGGGIRNAVAALACISWPKYARIARSQTLSVKSRTYMEAARLSGESAWKRVLRHIVPNIAGSVIVTAVLDIGTMMMEIAGLSYLGIGATAPLAEWGSMMSDGRSMLQTAPWVILAPGCAIFLTVMAFNLFGDAVRDALDPGQRKEALNG